MGIKNKNQALLNEKAESKAEKMYNEYIDRNGPNGSKVAFDRYDLFEMVVETYKIDTGIYPGSYIHITPSFFIPEMIYIDNAKKAKKFFEQKDDIIKLIDQNKTYDKEALVTYYDKDYWLALDVPCGHADLLISQYAGFVSQACKDHLKSGGILLVNDSHGDATLARFDETYVFIGVITVGQDGYEMIFDHLEDYFTFKRQRPVDLEKVKVTMKGPKYKKMPECYLFKKQ